MCHKWWSYDVWFLRYEVHKRKFFVILGYFLSFCPSNSLKNENFKKMKKHLEILSFNTSSPKIMIKWYMVPEIWRVADVIAILHFGPYFFLLPPSQPKKWKFQKKWKKRLDISSFYTCVPKIMIRWFTVPEIWCTTDAQTDRQTDRKSD